MSISLRKAFGKIEAATARWTQDYVDHTANLILMTEDEFEAVVCEDCEQPPLVEHVKKIAEDVRKMAAVIDLMAEKINDRAARIVDRNESPPGGA